MTSQSHHHSSDHETSGSGAPAAVSMASDIHPPPPPARWQHDDTSAAPRIRLMCSFGGRILPRPHDNQLRYVGGDTRIVAVHRNCTYSTLLSKLAKFTATADITIKYQLPNEDLDALISVTTDEDVENMMEEYDRILAHGSSSTNAARTTARLRLFLFPPDGTGPFGSILSGTGSSKHDHWFLDTLNGRTLERGRSEASSIVSEVPDYLFGLDNTSDEPMKPMKTNVSMSDPGSPAPVVSSPHYGSASSAYSIPIAPNPAPAEIVKPETMDSPVEPEVSQPGGYAAPHAVWQYVPETVPVYYVQGPAGGGSLPGRPVPMPMQYMQPVQHGQVPVGYRQVYVGAPATAGAYDYQAGMDSYEAMAAAPPPGAGLARNIAPPMYRPVMGAPPGSMGQSPAPATGPEARNIPRASQ